MKLYEFLQSLPDRDIVEPVEAGALLNRVQREWGWGAAKLSDVIHERNRRTKLRQKDAQFQRDLIAIETAMSLPLRTLAGPYWDIRATHPLEKSLPLLAEKAGVDLDRLTQECHRIRPPIKQGRPKGVPNSKPRVPRKAAPIKPTVATVKRPSARAVDPKTSPETVTAIRQRWLDGETSQQICKSQSSKNLPGCDRTLEHGHILYIITNIRHQKVGYPVLGTVIEQFNGRGAEGRAAAALRFRYRDILAKHATAHP